MNILLNIELVLFVALPLSFSDVSLEAVIQNVTVISGSTLKIPYQFN